MILLLSGIILAFFFTALLISKKNKSSADYILMCWLCFCGLHIMGFYFSYNNSENFIPSIRALSFSMPIAHGPFLYLYTTQQTTYKRFRVYRLLHFLPVVLSMLMFAKFHFMPIEKQFEIYKLKGKGFETQILLNNFAVSASGVFYTIFSLIKLLKYRKRMLDQFSNTEKINFNWLLYMIFWIMAIWIIVLFIKSSYLIFGFASMFVLWVGYFGTKQVQVFSQNNKTKNDTPIPISETIEEDEDDNIFSNSNYIKYQKSTLGEDDANKIHKQLTVLLNENKVFLNPELTLNELAKSLGIHPNHLSQVINSIENKNFYELINEQRIKEFIEQSKLPKNQHFTMLALAMDCGFNSKASFNRNFKNHTGVTPREYLKQNFD